MKKHGLMISIIVVIIAAIIAMGVILHNQKSEVTNSKPKSSKVIKTKTKKNSKKTDNSGQKIKTNDDVKANNATNTSSNSTDTVTSNKSSEATSSANSAENSSVNDNNVSTNPSSAHSAAQNGAGNVVNNANEAISVLKNGLGDNSDWYYQVLSTDNGVYEIQVISKSIKQQGGSGTIGIYRVMEDGTFGLRP